MSFHSSAKTSVNRTGVMFYSKLPDSENYRVKFKSFNLAVYENEDRINEMENMYKNYVLFKQGKCATRQRFSTSLATKIRNDDEKYKTNKDRLKQNENLRGRLKSMKNERKAFLDKIKGTTLTEQAGGSRDINYQNSNNKN